MCKLFRNIYTGLAIYKMNCKHSLHEFLLTLGELLASSRELQCKALRYCIIPQCHHRWQFMKTKFSIHAYEVRNSRR